MKVLIVEDDEGTVELLQLYFGGKGYDTEIASNGVEALERFAAAPPDLILLDIMLPQLDGWGVLKSLRSRSRVPVIVLTSLDHPEDAIKALEMGSDDYLRKPFNVRELDARIQAVLRRGQGSVESGPIEVGPFTIDDRTKSVSLEGGEIALSPKEYDLLKLLASDPGYVFSAEEIIVRVWKGTDRAASNDVKQYIHLLRKKVEHDPQAPKWIKTIKGFGYKLDV